MSEAQILIQDCVVFAKEFIRFIRKPEDAFRLWLAITTDLPPAVIPRAARLRTRFKAFSVKEKQYVLRSLLPTLYQAADLLIDRIADSDKTE